MANGPTVSGKGSGLSYQSSYLAWAATRAIHRKHWLLALVCTGAFFSQILTIAMSALWQRESSQQERPLLVAQPFQLREVPHLYAGYITSDAETYIFSTLAKVFENLETSWMYSAALYLSFNASGAPWSADDWSFVPVPIPLSSAQANQNLGDGNSSIQSTSPEATVDVPAIRARLECTNLAIDLEQRWWLTELDLSNKTYWNVSGPPQAWNKGYELGCDHGDNYDFETGFINLSPNETAVNCSSGSSSRCTCEHSGFTTDFVTAAVPMTCCGQDADGSPAFTSMGYWTPLVPGTWHDDPYGVKNNSNFTIKWIHGASPASFQTLTYPWPTLVWPDVPQLTMLNCLPIFETARAKVKLDLSTGNVHEYELLEEPQSYPLATADNFAQHQRPEFGNANFTTSFGAMFMAAILRAAQIDFLGGCSTSAGSVLDCYERTDDRTFNFKEPGINVDYMSYSMLSMANKNSSALLDHDTLSSLAKKTFSTFFQHFASSNISFDGTGGWVYQRPTESLPDDLVPVYSPYNTSDRAPYKAITSIAPSITATVIVPIEVLHISPIAIWICLIILAWLITTCISILVLKGKYFSPLLHGVETPADVMSMVAGSEQYLALARREGATGLRADKSFKTRLGWFRTKGGEVRWGIELTDTDEVEFLSPAEVEKMLGKKKFDTTSTREGEVLEMTNLVSMGGDLEDGRPGSVFGAPGHESNQVLRIDH